MKEINTEPLIAINKILDKFLSQGKSENADFIIREAKEILEDLLQ